MPKASENIRYYKNEQGPIIGTVLRNVIKEDGLFFKDIDGSGKLSVVNDWRLPAEKRAKAYTECLSIEEKIGQLFISDWRMGKYPSPLAMGSKEIPQYSLDESGLLDEAEHTVKTIFGEQYVPGTSKLLKEWFARHIILRTNALAEDLADYMNQLQKVAEECTHFVPVSAASNSRNENGEVIFGMNDAAGVFPTWPGTLGIAAAVKGSGIEIADQFADCVRRTWNACGLRKGYMYMADVMTDPRWQRSYGTFGEEPEIICEILAHIIPRIQGSENGVTSDGVAMTIKHFPGGGARENGFAPHYAAGQWNVYRTEGSLQKYHLPGFQTAVNYHTASIMPYYAKPAAEKSAFQSDISGNEIEMQPYGFAYNKPFIDDLLRKQMGFQGYINSDTGIIHNMKWGVERLDEPERIGFAVNHAGVDLISGLFDNEFAKEAYERSQNDYYQMHKVPEGFQKEEIVLNENAINRAVARTMQEMFALGMFENPYREPKDARKAAEKECDWDSALEAHQKSVTLLKNDGTIPMVARVTEKKKFYVECFHKKAEIGRRMTDNLKEMLNDLTITEKAEEADFAILMLYPSSGDYFSATSGYLELDICEDKEVQNVDENCCPMQTTHLETTLSGASRIAAISEKIHKKGGKVIMNVNVTLAWLLGNVEPYADVLLAGYDTYPSAILDVIFGNYRPTGKLPITFPRNEAVIAVDENGICVSPNDVPGYEKDLYLPEFLKDENGRAYAYRDTAGNYYEVGFGLQF